MPGQKRHRTRSSRYHGHSKTPRRHYVRRTERRHRRSNRHRDRHDRHAHRYSRRRGRSYRGGKSVNLGFSKISIPSLNQRSTFLPATLMNTFWNAEGALARVANAFKGRPNPIQLKASPTVQQRVAAPKIRPMPDIGAAITKYGTTKA